MKIKTLSLFLMMAFYSDAQQLQKPVSGKIDRIEKFQSQFVDARHIDIWLPENYDGKKKFAVLYMHDGQMLFDSTTTWNHQSWNVDDVASRLMKDKKVKNFIVVGIWNSGKKRHADYFPQKPFESLTQVEKETAVNQLKKYLQTTDAYKPNSDNYLKFLVTELKPMIDKKYAVYTDRQNTFIGGSSMGGLISMYALCEYPNVFGGMACLSTHWTGSYANDNNPIPGAFIKYVEAYFPEANKHKIYFDTGDQGIDAYYPVVQHKIDSILMKKGFTGKYWMTKYFEGKDHNENAWSERLYIPLLFLLRP